MESISVLSSQRGKASYMDSERTLPFRIPYRLTDDVYQANRG